MAKKVKDKEPEIRIIDPGEDVADAESNTANTVAESERYSRLLAEFDNFRKRAERERGAAYDAGAAAVLLKMLPVADNFERALKSTDDKEGTLYKGVEMIYKQLTTAFDGLGVTAIDAAGKPFDPELHEAVMHVEDEEQGESIVAQELQRGYMFRERVLRHSMVKVAN